MYLLDTNVISELRKRERCDASVASWWSTIAEGDLFLSVLVLGEIRQGLERLRNRDARRASALERWLAEVAAAFAGRVLPVDAAVAEEWGRISARRPTPVVDAMLAATAIVNDLTLVTRNVTDVAHSGAKLLDPWARR